MQLHRVVDAVALPVPLDPLATAVFVALFVAAALLTMRRASYGAIALILADPFALTRYVGATTVTIPKAVLLGVLIGLCAYAGNAARLREYPALRLTLAFAVVAVATALTIPQALHAEPALRETVKALFYLAFFVAAYLCFRIDGDSEAAGTAFAVVTIAVALTALAQEFANAPSALCIGAFVVPRIAGVLEGPNQLAGYLEISVAVLGALSLRQPSALRSIALALAAFAGVLTFSRAGIAGIVVVLAILLAVAGRAHWRRLLPAAYGLLAGCAGLAGWSAAARSGDVLRLSFEESFCAGGVGNRSELWRAAFEMWKAHPLTGIGAGNLELELAQYGAAGVRTHANSWYLQSLAEGGLVLFAAVLALLGSALWTFRRGLRDAQPWAIAAFAATVALALHQIVDDLVFYPKVGGAWCVLLGLAVACVARSR